MSLLRPQTPRQIAHAYTYWYFRKTLKATQFLCKLTHHMAVSEQHPDTYARSVADFKKMAGTSKHDQLQSAEGTISNWWLGAQNLLPNTRIQL
jgi:hypothetical protein